MTFSILSRCNRARLPLPSNRELLERSSSVAKEKPGLAAPARTIASYSLSLSVSDVLCLHPLPALGRLVGHLGALFERLEPFARYACVVNEEILAPIIRGDKAVALLVAEPLNRSLGHIPEPTFHVPGLPANKKPPFVNGWRSICCKPTL